MFGDLINKLKNGVGAFGNDIVSGAETVGHDIGNVVSAGVHDIGNFFGGGNNNAPSQSAPAQQQPRFGGTPIQLQQQQNQQNQNSALQNQLNQTRLNDQNSYPGSHITPLPNQTTVPGGHSLADINNALNNPNLRAQAQFSGHQAPTATSVITGQNHPVMPPQQNNQQMDQLAQSRTGIPLQPANPATQQLNNSLPKNQPNPLDQFMGVSRPSQGIQPIRLAPPKQPTLIGSPPDNLPQVGDTAGLTKALKGIDSLKPEDQVRILNRSAQTGLIPRNLSAAYINDILMPGPEGDRSNAGMLAQAAEQVLLPGASIAKQIGSTLGENQLYNQALSGKPGSVDPGTALNIGAEANAENGGIVNQYGGINPGHLAAAGINEGLKAATLGLGGEGGLVARGADGSLNLGQTAANAGIMGAKYGIPMGASQSLYQDANSPAQWAKNITEGIAQAEALPLATGFLNDAGIALEHNLSPADNFSMDIEQNKPDFMKSNGGVISGNTIGLPETTTPGRTGSSEQGPLQPPQRTIDQQDTSLNEVLNDEQQRLSSTTEQPQTSLQVAPPKVQPQLQMLDEKMAPQTTSVLAQESQPNQEEPSVINNRPSSSSSESATGPTDLVSQNDSQLNNTPLADIVNDSLAALKQEGRTIEGYHTPVTKGMESAAASQSAGLPDGKYIALDKPFESEYHNPKMAQRVRAEVGKVYDPDGVLGNPTPALRFSAHANTPEVNARIQKAYNTPSANVMDAMAAGSKATAEEYTKFLQSHGYDSYVRNIDGMPGNRELIVFDRNKVTPSNEAHAETNATLSDEQNAGSLSGQQSGGKEEPISQSELPPQPSVEGQRTNAVNQPSNPSSEVVASPLSGKSQELSPEQPTLKEITQQPQESLSRSLEEYPSNEKAGPPLEQNNTPLGKNVNELSNNPELASLFATEPQRAWDQVVDNPEDTPIGDHEEPANQPKIDLEKLPDNSPLAHAYNTIIDESKPVYNTHSGSGSQLVRGRIQAGIDVAKAASNYIRKLLPSAEDRIALQLYADGSIDKVSPRVKQVYEQARPIYQAAGVVRQQLDPEMHLIENYAPRVTSRNLHQVNAMLRPSGVNSETRSPFDNARTIQKFVDEKGNTVIGSPDKLDLALAHNGKYYDRKGNEFSPTRAKQSEIVNAGKARYQLDAAKNLELYVADTMRMVEHNKFIDYLKTLGANPDKQAVPEKWVRLSQDIPGLEGLYFDPKVARNIENFTMKPGAPKPLPIRLAGRGLSMITNLARTLMLDNPIVHPLNMEFNAFTRSGSPLGAVRFIFNQLRGSRLGVAFRLDEGNEKYYEEMHRAGGSSLHMTTSNAGESLAFKLAGGNKTLHQLGITADKINPMNLNHEILNRADEGIRVALYRSLRERGKTPVEAAKEVNKALVDYANIGDTEKQIGKVVWFYPWLKGNAINAMDLVIHPLTNMGNIATIAVVGTALLEAQNAWRHYTGNPHATIRFPGIFGIIKSLAEAPGQVKKGQVPGFITGRINPFIGEGLQQYSGKDSFTGQPITNRLQHFENTFIGNSGTVESSKKSTGEKVANIFGFSESHVKGAPAAPNQKSGIGGLFNMPGAKPAKDEGNIHDPTGIDQVNDYYKRLNALMSSVKGDTTATNAVNKFLQHDKTPDGKTILASQPQKASDWADLATNNNALQNIQKFYKSQANHEPSWDLTGTGVIPLPDGSKETISKMRIWATYKALPPGDLEKDAIAQNNPWITQTEQADSQWAQNQSFAGNTVNSPDYVPYPNIDSATNDKMSQISSLAAIAPADRSPDQIAELNALENDPDVQAAYQALDKYTNDVRVKWGLTPINYAPTSSPEVQDWTNAYMAANSATRKQMKTANPDMYNQMEQSMENQQLAGVEKQAGIGYYSGKPNNSFLGDIYGLGQYDISKVKNPNGTTSYGLTNFVPSAANSLFDNGINTIDATTAAALKKSGSSYRPLVARPKIKKGIKVHHVARANKMRKPNIKIAKSRPYYTKPIKLTTSKVATPTHIVHIAKPS